MNDEAQPAGKRHYHMFSIMVIYLEAGKERRQFLNTVNPSDHAYVNSMDLARVQQNTQFRFQSVFDKQKKFKLLDLYVQSISYMGHMTDEEFDGGFSALTAPKAPEPPAQEPGEEEVVA